MKQNTDEASSPEDLAVMDTLTQKLRDETSELDTTAKSLRSTLSSLNSTMSTADLRASVTSMEAEREEILVRLTARRAGTVQPVSKEEKEEVDKQVNMWDKIVTRRTRIVRDMWGQIAEGLPEGMQATELKVSSFPYAIMKSLES
jgi:26S proteasome regulatory subunit, ATPase 3, interacting protein